MAKKKSFESIYNMVKKYGSSKTKIRMPKTKFKLPKITGIKIRRMK